MSKRPPMIFQYVQKPRLVDVVIDRLAELAAGAPLDEGRYGPSTGYGICYQMKSIVDKNGGGWLQLHTVDCSLNDIFIRLGRDKRDPLGDFDKPGNRWSGRRGARRRRLCFDLMVQLIASAGYRGKYD